MADEQAFADEPGEGGLDRVLRLAPVAATMEATETRDAGSRNWLMERVSGVLRAEEWIDE